jgi:3-methyladenine DNA glycosylase AlkC
MAVRTPAELRAAAEEFRRLSTEGEDPRLQAALLLVADEFDQEANKMEAKAAQTK